MELQTVGPSMTMARLTVMETRGADTVWAVLAPYILHVVSDGREILEVCTRELRAPATIIQFSEINLSLLATSEVQPFGRRMV